MLHRPTMKVMYVALGMFLLAVSCVGMEKDLTVSIDPGKSDCFYQAVTEGQTIDIEYQVIDGGQGALDVGFQLSAPGGRIMTAQPRRQAGSHHEKAPVTGDYRFCFDNTHSAFNSKTVYFDLMIDGDLDEDDSEEEMHRDTEDEGHTGEDSDPSLATLGTGWHRRVGEAAAKVRAALLRARRLQETSSASASRDGHRAERSLWRVTLCGAVQVITMLAVGLLQVVMVRSLFDERSRLHGIFKKLPLSKS